MKNILKPTEIELRYLNKLKEIDPLMYNRYMIAPASSKYHGVYRGGLLNHSINVTRHLLEWKEKHPYANISLDDCYYIGLFHDLCKNDAYIRQQDGTYKAVLGSWSHHALKSIELIQALNLFELTTMRKVCILLHMSSWENDEDIAALTKEDLEWLKDIKNQRLVRAVNWADMRSEQDEMLQELKWKKRLI